ncbi:unnamed protein product [Durusdinium trenchii]|uniref:Uncharacterized protein n=1 Tax=Durusdinium trenchii TaxID=1381693 RepID=A0ABP0JHQ1_9DINO
MWPLASILLFPVLSDAKLRTTTPPPEAGVVTPLQDGIPGLASRASLAPLRAELLRVSEDLASIGERVKQLAQRLNELEGSASEDLEWEVIEEGNLPLGVSDLEFPYPGASQVPQAQPIPSVPRYLSDLCQESLKSVASISPLERAQRAFTQGHLAWVARVTGLHYRPADAVPALPSAHFVVVVIRGLGLSQALRTTTKREAPCLGSSGRHSYHCTHLRASTEAMRDPNLLVFSIPSEVSKTGGNLQVFAIPVLQRDGGFLVALPVESFSNEALETAAHADEHELLGPSHTCVAQLSEEDENGQEVMIDQEILVLLHWARMPSDLSQKRRRQVHLNRAVHIIVLALNYYHNGGPCKLDLLGRAPSTSHRRRSLIRSEGQVAIPCIANSGRRLPQLVARLSELSVALTAMGPSCNPYDRSFDGFEVLPDTEADELKPYRNLDSSRLVLTGRGAWDATEYLEDELVLAYREPASLLFSHEPCPSQVPAISDHPSEVAALARLWDNQDPKIIRLPRTTAKELVLASVLVPLMCAELSAEFSTQVFCSDASSNVGAFCAATVPRAVSRVLWKVCKSKGAYTRMMSPVEAEIFKLGGSEEFEGKEEVKPTSIRRPLAYRFDFIELFAVAAKVTHSMEAKGWSACGKLTKASAMYTDGLADALATVLSEAINARASADIEWDQVQTAGLENALVNQVYYGQVNSYRPDAKTYGASCSQRLFELLGNPSYDAYTDCVEEGLNHSILPHSSAAINAQCWCKWNMSGFVRSQGCSEHANWKWLMQVDCHSDCSDAGAADCRSCPAFCFEGATGLPGCECHDQCLRYLGCWPSNHTQEPGESQNSSDQVCDASFIRRSQKMQDFGSCAASNFTYSNRWTSLSDTYQCLCQTNLQQAEPGGVVHVDPPVAHDRCRASAVWPMGMDAPAGWLHS